MRVARVPSASTSHGIEAPKAATERRQILGGRYAVLKELGRGASGVVLLCRRKEDHVLFAVKEIVTGTDVAERKRIYEEGRLMLNIPPHPSIVRIEEVSESRESVFLVIEYVPDGSLHDLVYTDEVLDIQERRREDKRRKDSKHDRKEVRRQRRLARHVRKLARDSPSAAAEHHDAPGGGGGRGWGESNSDWADGNTHRSHQASDAGTPTHGGGGFGSAGRNALMGLFAQESVGGAAVQRVVSSGGFSAGDDVWGDDGVAEAYHMGDSPWGHDGDFDHRTPTDELSSLTTDGDEKDGEGEDSSDNDRDPPGVEAPPPRPVPFLKEATVSAWMSQLANAVEYLHSLRIAHRDIKLENILISSGGAVVKVCDFGVAATIPEHHPHRGGGSVVAATPTARGTMLGLKPQSAQSTIRPLMAAAIQHSTASPRRLPEGPLVDSHNSGVGGFLEHTTVGTPQYMPPEICDGRAHDLKCDVWSLGVTFYELCARELPFEATNMLALMHRIMEEPAAPLPHPPYSPHLSAIILAMLTKEPSRRPSISQVTQMFQFYRKCRARFEQDAEEEMLRQLSQRRSSAAGSMSVDAAAPGLRNPLLDGWFSDMPFSGDLGVPGFTPAPQPTNFRTLDEMMRAGSANTSFAARSTASSALASIDSSAFTPFHPIAAEGVFPGPPTTASGMVSVVEVPARFSVPPPLQPTNLELALLHPPIRNSHQPNPLNHLGTSPLTGESVSSRSESGSCSPTTTESRSSFAGISPESARILASIILPSSANTPRRNVHSAQPSLGGGRGGSGRISLNNGAKGSSSLSGSGNDAPRRDSSAESVIDATPSTTPTPPATKNSQLVNAMNSGQLPPRPPGLNRAVVAGMARTAGTAEGLSAAMAAKADVLRELQEMGELVSSTTMMSGSHSLRKVGASPIHDAGPRWVSDSQSDALSHGDPKPKTAPMGGGVRAGGRLGGGSSSNVLDATPQQVGTNHAGGLRTPFSGFQLSPDALQMKGNAPPAPPARSSISGGGGGVAPGASPTSESPVNASFALGRPLPFAALVGGGVNGWSASTLDESATLQKNAVASSSSINPNASGILETSAHLGHATSGGDTGSFENTPLTTGRRHGNPWRHHHGDVGESPLDGVRNVPTPGGSSSLSAVEGDLCHNGVVTNDDDSSLGGGVGGADNNVFLHSTALAAFLSGGGEFLEAGEVPPLNTFGSLQSTLGTTTYVVLRAGEGEKSEGGGTLPYGAKRQEMLGSLADGDLNTSAQTATNDETPTKLGKSPFAASPNSATASPEVLRRTQSGAGDGGPNELTEMGITGDSSEDEGAELRFAASPYSALKRREPHSEGLQPPPRHRRETASYDGGVEGQGGDSPTRGEIVSTIAAYNAAPPDVNKSMQELLREENEREAQERRILARARSGARTSSQETPLVRGTKGDSRSASFGDDSSSQSPGQVSFSTHSPEPGPPLTTTAVGPVTGAVLPLGIDVGGGRDPRYTWRLPTVPPSEPAVLSPTAVHTLPSGNNSVLASIFDLENANGSSSTTNRLARNSSLVAADVSLISLPVSTVNNRLLLPGNTAANRPDASRSLLNDFRAAEEGASRRESTYSEVGVLTNTITPRPSLVDVPKALGPSGSDVVLEDLLDETPRHGTSCHPHTPPVRPVDGGDSTHSDHARLHHAAAANHHHRSRRHSASGSGNPLLVPSSLSVGLQQGTAAADAAPFSTAPPLTIPHPGVTYRKDSTGSSGGGTLGPPEDADVPRRRASSMWGLDGPISSQQYANPHHSRTSTTSFREGNVGREGAGRNGGPRGTDEYDAESSERFPGYEEFTPTNGDISKGSGATPPTRTPKVPPPAVRGGCPCVIC